MELSLELIKELREKTGAGISDCKKALTEAKCNLEKAVAFIREKGLATAAKKSGRVASQGLVDSYIHANGRMGALVEVNCETDFVAKTDEFKTLAHDIALHVTGANPLYLNQEAVPAELVAKEKEIYIGQAKNEGHTGDQLEKIVAERMKKFLNEICLMDQPFIRDQGKTVADLIGDTVAKIGENVVIKRFVRFQLGDK